jgi:EmrB/QacA subfamily drug resistance transporter
LTGEVSAGKTTQRSLVLASIMLAMFMAAIEATIVATAMPDIVGRLGGFEVYSWVFAGFLLSQTATTVVFGKLADLYGRRPVLIGGIVVFLIGSLLCGFAWSMPALIGFRILQGLGGGSIMPVATTIIGDLYTPEERGSIQGYLSSVWGVSAVLGPLAGGLIVEKLSWPWVFWINIPVGIATVVMLRMFLHEDIVRKSHKVDYLGAAFFAAAVSGLLVVLTQFGQSKPNYGMLAAAAVTFLVATPLFVWQERRAEEPMIAFDIWTDPLIAAINAATLTAGMALMGLTTFLAIYVHGVLGESATVAGLTLTMMAVGWPIAALLARRGYKTIGMRATLRIGGALLVLGSIGLLFLNPKSSPFWAGASSFVIGFGMGLYTVTCILLIQGSVGWKQRGSATASNVFARNLGSTLGATVLGMILNFGLRGYQGGVSPEAVRGLLEQPEGARASTLVQGALAHGLHLTFWGVLVLSLITAGLALRIPDRQLHELTGGADA